MQVDAENAEKSLMQETNQGTASSKWSTWVVFLIYWYPAWFARTYASSVYTWSWWWWWGYAHESWWPVVGWWYRWNYWCSTGRHKYKDVISWTGSL